MGRKVEKEATNHLRAWREYRGMTQNELADRIDTKGNVIGMLESGERQLSPKWLEKLAPALGTTPGFLLDYSPYDIDAAFIDEMRQVPKSEREKLIQIAKLLRTGTAD